MKRIPRKPARSTSHLTEVTAISQKDKSAPLEKGLPFTVLTFEKHIFPGGTAGDDRSMNPEIALLSQRLVMMQDALSLLKRQLETIVKSPGDSRKEVHLTARERQILNLLKNGASNKEMAVILSIGVQTIKNHVHMLYEKLGIENRAQVVRIASDASNSASSNPSA